jgi:hypothetical protein
MMANGACASAAPAAHDQAIAALDLRFADKLALR